MIPKTAQVSVRENGTKRLFEVTRRGVGPLVTDLGTFQMFDFEINDIWRKYTVLTMSGMDDKFMPVFRNKKSILVRIDSGCETGQLFGDQTCDCRQQLYKAMTHVQQVGEGIIVNIQQHDGRGMGLPFKLATLALQAYLDMDTVEAAQALALDEEIDIRTYSGVICILNFFRISQQTRIRVVTNNPSKLKIFKENGFKLQDIMPVVIPPNKFTLKHLLAKQLYLGHIDLVSEFGKNLS